MTDTPSPALQVSTAVTADQHGAKLVVIAILGLIASVLLSATRLVLRWPWKQRFGMDDVVCMVATVVAAAQTGTLLGAVRAGFGTRSRLLSADEIKLTEKMVYASNILYVLALCLSKLAVGCLFCRLSPHLGATAIIYAILIYGIAGILIVAVSHKMVEPWQVISVPGRATLARWAAVEALGMALDAALMFFPASLVRRLKLSRSTKIAVFLGFALRFPAIVFASLRIAAIASMEYQDFTFSYINAEIYGQVEMHYNVVAATIPCLRIFLKSWNTSFISTTLEEMDPEAYTKHSSVASPSRTPRQSKCTISSKTKRLSWRFRHDNRNEIFDGPRHGTESSISSDRIGGSRQVSAGSKNSITVQRSVSVDVT